MFEKVYEKIRPISIIIIHVLLVAVLFSVFVYFIIEIDKSKLSEMSYCPSCGIDLINKY